MDITNFASNVQAMLAPIILSIAILSMMLQIAFWRHAITSWLICCLTLIASIAALYWSSLAVPQSVSAILVSDDYSLFFSLLILFSSLITALLAKDYLAKRSGENEEFYLLLMLSTLGGLILVSSTHLASLLLGLELLGVALYALIAYPERGHIPLEAAIKYLILSGAASAILLFGFALIYAALGTLSFAEIGQQLSHNIASDRQLLVLIGTAMVFAGISFKLSLVPFHMWTPDVYQGAPAPVTGFLATVSKGAIFAALMRLFIDAQLYRFPSLLLALGVVAAASMIIGNLLALKQNNLKRLLAYSSIAHIGYLIITIVVYGSLQKANLAVEAASFYLTAYMVTSLAAFSVISILSTDPKFNTDEADADSIDSVRGLFWNQPLLALLLTIALLSLAGIPLTVGFIGKFYIFTVAIEGALWLLIMALVVGSGIGIYYYLRIVFAMTEQPNQKHQAAISTVSISTLAKIVASLLIFLMLTLGILPQPLIEQIANLY
ncbi:MAG: NADH-quinone oxidoreductase subunit N [Arenicella sp.]|jgi:NADH-quinone oxidoreductase subunit N